MRNEKDEGSLGRVAYWDDSTKDSLVFSLPLASRRVLFRSVLITIRLEQVMSKASSELFEMWCILSSVIERTKMLSVLLWRWDGEKKKQKKNVNLLTKLELVTCVTTLGSIPRLNSIRTMSILFFLAPICRGVNPFYETAKKIDSNKLNWICIQCS